MKSRLIAAAIASMFVGLGAQTLAQSNADRGAATVTQPDKRDSFTHGESKRCESMTGADKARCDKEEATKSEGDAGQASQPAATDNQRSSAGSTAAGKTFTHGESKRCESMTGAEKDQCDKEEATKTEGDAAREASK
jgi:hypothetical protein